MDRPRRPRLGGALVLFLLVLVATTAWIGLRALAAQRHLEDARGSLSAARDALVERNVDAARAAIEAAGDDTERARALTSDPVWAAAGALPGYGDAARTVTGLAAAADELAREVLPQALDGAERLDPTRLRSPEGVVDLGLVRAATSPVVASAATVTRVQREVQQLPTRNAVRQVAEAKADLEGEVDELTRALRGAAIGLELAAVLLGEDRPRRFFVLVQQNAESRGTGGLPGGFAILETSGGRLSVPVAGSRQDLEDGSFAVPPGVPDEFVARYGKYGSFDILVNINISPDLPVVSRLIAQRWREGTSQEIDGVISLDAQALAMILSGSGPVDVDGRQLQPEELVDYLAVGQYEDFAAPVGAGIDLSKQRKEALSEVARETADRLASGGGDNQALLSGLVRAVRSGHLRMTSDDPALATALTEAEVAGALPDGTRPTAYPVVFNSTGGKLDTFLDRSVSYRAEGCHGDTRRSTVSVTLTNEAPAEGLPAYVRIRDDGSAVYLSTENAVTLSVYSTPGSRLRSASLDGAPLDPSNPDLPLLRRFREGGLQGYELFLDLPRDQPRTLVLELDEPVLPGEAQVPEQPLARPLERLVEVPAC